MRYIVVLLLLMITLSANDLYKKLSSKQESFTQTAIDTRFRITFENIPLANSKDMGVLGTHYDIFPIHNNPLYLSFGFYNAMTGEDGGFFTFGYTLGVDYEVYKNLFFDGGVYVGGGSGKYIGFDNGGLMVRSHFGLSYEFASTQLTFGLSRTSFPHTTTNKEYENDIHPFFALHIDDQVWKGYTTAKHGVEKNFNGFFRNIRITPVVVYYDIDEKKTKRVDLYSGDDLYQENFPMLGIALERFVNKEVFVSMEAYGALGSAAGYAAIEAGLGYELALSRSFAWESKMVIGSAGDGRIDTAGGFVVQPMTGLRYKISSSYSLKTLVGRTYAPGGKFSATTYEVGLSFDALQAKPKAGVYSFSKSRFSNLKWTMSPSYKYYIPYDSTHKGESQDSSQEIGLIGIMIGVDLNDYVRLLGTTHWAATGNVGSYAEGLFGLKLSTPAFSSLGLKAVVQAEAGAGAGGSINTSSGGYVTQFLGGLEVPIFGHSTLGFYGGDMQTSDGRFKARTFMASLNIGMNFLHKKRE